jgi:hypothetical protein
MSNYWIKLYHEILDDPKMGVLPDRLWRRCIELFLLAGRSGVDGKLPNTQQLAWTLRMSGDDLQGDLDQLLNTGIIEPIPNGWVIVNFAKRQAAVPDAERKAQQREREKTRQYYGNVTDTSRSVTQINRLTELETEADENGDDGPAFKANPLSVAFEQSAKILAPGGNPASWIGACETMQKQGITPEEVKQAVFELNRKGYVIVGPQSVVNAALNVHTKHSTKKQVFTETYE